MVRVAGVVLAAKKHIVIALQGIYGIGPKTSSKICEIAGVSESIKVSDLSEENIKAIQQAIVESGYKLEGELRRKVSMDIKRLKDIKCYRGLRHRRRLPVRGQRTKTNARTAKGRKKSSDK